MDFNLYTGIPIIEVIFCLILLVILTLYGLRHVARVSFLVFLIFMILWGIFLFLMRASPSLQEAVWWDRLIAASILCSSLSFLWFTIILTGSNLNRLALYTLCGVGVLMAILAVASDLVIADMQLMWYGKAPVLGPLFPPFLLINYAPLVFSLWILFNHYRQSRIAMERVRYSYIIAGVFVTIIGGTTDFLPSLGVPVYPLGIIGSILFCLLTSIAMLRYGLLEIKVMLRKGLVYSLVSMFVLGVFGVLLFMITGVVRELFSPLSIILAVMAVFIIAAVIQPFLYRVQQTVDRLFYRERYSSLESLKRFAAETKEITNVRQLTSSLVTLVANSLQSKAVYLLLPNLNTGDFGVFARYGHGAARELLFPVTTQIVSLIKRHDGILDYNEIAANPDTFKLTKDDWSILESNNIEIVLPLKTHTRLVGMLLIGAGLSSQPYSVEDRQLLSNAADELAVAIDNASTLEKIQRERGDLEKAMDGIISAMSLVVEARDPYTSGHQQRVASLSCAIAREMGLSQFQVNGIHVIGVLHDIGKMVVPAEILSKPGKINEHEFSLIKSHPKVGYDILKSILFPWPVAQAIYQHHERLDGSGYPRGLYKQDIILEARILAVADVIEAMSSHRPYRPAIGADRAMAEITTTKDILYDGEVVEASLRLYNKMIDFEKIFGEPVVVR